MAARQAGFRRSARLRCWLSRHVTPAAAQRHPRLGDRPHIVARRASILIGALTGMA